MIELTSRELDLAELKQELAQLDEEILHGLQEDENRSAASNQLFKTLRIRADLFDKKASVRDQLHRLKAEIAGGESPPPTDEKQRAASRQRLFSENWFSKFSSNTLLVPLIILTAFTGAAVHIVRGKKDEPIALSLASGLGVGIFCLLFLSTGADAINSAFSTSPSLNVSTKVLIAFLAGLFMKELYNVLSTGVPELFYWVAGKLGYQAANASTEPK